MGVAVDEDLAEAEPGGVDSGLLLVLSLSSLVLLLFVVLLEVATPPEDRCTDERLCVKVSPGDESFERFEVIDSLG